MVLGGILVERDVKEALLKVLQFYAPNGPAQEKCSEFFRAMEMDPDMDDKDIVEGLGNALLDGIRWGNWLWNDIFDDVPDTP